jgi:hypothetical protein
MSREDKEVGRAKGKAERVSDKNDKQTDRPSRASDRIKQPGQEIADDEVTIAKTGNKA